MAQEDMRRQYQEGQVIQPPVKKYQFHTKRIDGGIHVMTGTNFTWHAVTAEDLSVNILVTIKDGEDIVGLVTNAEYVMREDVVA